ncbi:meiosis-specific with OB domain-containing protein isoform X1 [Scyliorhinus canicula]|uniref:meiosis-specific with OB domain-containing protein isoform X1 n=1 Tax=Scyliorhinus canicula TaxID=7830 RepID=UPI0018F42F37|nr:meiosis-specific with OB domain-containing protein isoform X1 [Scyliorhinus canicula]XP_038676848.1 meiosis-specific with OB domain-containing protein isoform X1 [Scyliorhinus canicula]
MMAFSSSGQNLVPISDLHPNSARPSVAGVVIGKIDAKGFPDRKNIGTERYTFTFTIRDCPTYFINVASWGREEYIRGLSNSFRIGDCVIIENPLVQAKDAEKEERFSPSTSSCYKLLVSENFSTVRMCHDVELETRLLSLLHLPVKDPQDYYSLGDIVHNGQSLNGNIINILASVRSVGEQKHFTTTDKRKGQRCEVRLFDETVPSFLMNCWDNESIQHAQTWIPKETDWVFVTLTVLFIADVRVNYDGFRNSMAATLIAKTIITTNPDTKEANLLYNFAKECAENDEDPEQANELINLHSIVDVFTVQQLKNKVMDKVSKPEPIYGIIYAYITMFNIDSDSSKIIKSKCGRCRFLIDVESNVCTNPSCSSGTMNPSSIITSFDFWVEASDHTGTLQSCNLTGSTAEKTLGYTTDEFCSLTEEQKTSLKWNFLLERCKIYLKLLASSSARNGIRTSLLSCEIADPEEASQTLSTIAIFRNSC